MSGARKLGRDGRGTASGVALGALAGAAAWVAMDHVLRAMYNHEWPDVRRREDRARHGVPALEVAAERAAASAGVPLGDADRQAAGTAAQWMLGLGAGTVYGALAPRVPWVRAGRGLAFGAAFSLLVDEGATPLLGLAPGPRAFPWQTHARGFIGHLVFGAALDAALRLAESARRPPRRAPEPPRG